MQLIIETEPTVDIKRNMTTVDESLVDKVINGLTEDIKHEVNDGNKENGKSKDSVLLDAIGKATNDLIDDINAGNLFIENETEQDLSNDGTVTTVQNFVTALINDIENKDCVLSVESSIDTLDESNSDSNNSEANCMKKKTNAESDVELVNISIEIEKTIEQSPLQEHHINPTSTENVTTDENVSEENILIPEESNIQIGDEAQKEGNFTVKESDLIQPDNKDQIEGGPEKQKNIIIDSVMDDTISGLEEETLVQVESKTVCLEDVVSISDEDKECLGKDEDDRLHKSMVNVPIDDDVSAVQTVVEVSRHIQKAIEEVKFVDDKSKSLHENATSKDPLQTLDKTIPDIVMDCEEVTEVHSTDSEQNTTEDLREEDLNINDAREIQEIIETKEAAENITLQPEKSSSPEPENIINVPQTFDSQKRRPSTLSKLSNTLDILSDDDEDETMKRTEETKKIDNDDKCINIEDDDDVMVIDDVTTKDMNKTESFSKTNSEKTSYVNPEVELGAKAYDENKDGVPVVPTKTENETTSTEIVPDVDIQSEINEKPNLEKQKLENEKPLLPENFLRSAKNTLANMTRDDLEEFCILKIVEGVLDRGNLNEIKSKLKTMAQNIDEYRKKAMILTKQNRDLQVVLKSVQEELKKNKDDIITPLKITRSVGMQVVADFVGVRKKNTPGQNAAQNNNTNKQTKNTNQRSPKAPNSNQAIPVPRLVPAVQTNAGNKSSTSPNMIVNQGKIFSPVNGIKIASPAKPAEKRAHNKSQSVTVDLTDDEPPAKVVTRSSTTPPVRLVPSQNLLAPTRQPFAANSGIRKVYIPISGQGQNIRPGQTIMLKSSTSPGPRQRGPTPNIVRAPQSQIRPQKLAGARHPAPLPEPMKQYQPPNWKSLPPAPELKLSKVENGIVISWKIEGYQDDSYEEIASYQLYAYQETSSPPNTALWKKIGDVKALPLPMACTLTQFMAGFKYYFAVRAIDVRSRLGPFSLPGSILLLNKM